MRHHGKMIEGRFSGANGDYLFSIGDVDYIAPKKIPAQSMPNPGHIRFRTVFSLDDCPDHVVTEDWISAKVEEYMEMDDVFDAVFLQVVSFHSTDPSRLDVLIGAINYLLDLGSQGFDFDTDNRLLPGLYCTLGDECREIWKVVDDTHGSCMTTFRPSSGFHNSPFEQLDIKTPGSQFNSFAIPSRLMKPPMSTISPSPPSSLTGLRVLIKDNIATKGIKTSNGNKAFHATYAPQPETATCVRRILDLGMFVVGKTKMTSFANWEEPVEYVDYQAPWNPRADGYQSPGGSSSGSAVAVAAYEWCDLAVGTDTWGSVTRPALWCGCFGLRPTWGSVPSDGIEPFCQDWDTAGVLSRDLQICRDFSSAWLLPDKLKSDPATFSSIIWPSDYWSIIDSEQINIAKGFVENVKGVLGVECTEVSFQELWETTPPDEGKGQSLEAYLNKATFAQCYDAYHNLDDFRTRHNEMFGCAPYVSPPNQQMWSHAKKISREERDKDFAKLEVYRQWLMETVLSGTNSDALVVMPLESMTPRYRDDVPTFRRPPQEGVGCLAIAPILNAPVLAVPVAEIPYHSRITDREEKLPFVMAIMGPTGTDISLMDTMLRVLKRSGMPTAVKAGRTMV